MNYLNYGNIHLRMMDDGFCVLGSLYTRPVVQSVAFYGSSKQIGFGVLEMMGWEDWREDTQSFYRLN